MSRKKAFFVLAAVAGLAAAGLSAAAARPPRPVPGPETAVVHRTDQDPAEVDRHWTPERIRQADENMRHQSGPDD